MMGSGGIKSLSTAGLLIGVVLALAGCNTIAGTVSGIGRDISAIGDALSGAVGGGCARDRCRNRSRRSGRYLAADHQRPPTRAVVSLAQ